MKIELDYSAIDTITQKLNAMGTNYKPEIENAMRESFTEIDNDIESALSPHYRNQSKLRLSRIRDFRPEWGGDVLSVPVGMDFNISGAVHAILLKYGTGPRSTKTHSTGSMPVDSNVTRALDENRMKEIATEKVTDALVDKIVKLGG